MKSIRSLLAALLLAGILGLNVAPVSADDSDADNNSATEIGELRENYVLGDG